MSIWDEDLSDPAGWPDWFVAYRSAEDAAMEGDFAAIMTGEITRNEHGARAVRRVVRRREWVESLPSDRRALLEVLDREGFEDGTTFWAPTDCGPEIDMDKVRASQDPVREYLRQRKAASRSP